jgi:integrase
VGRLRVAFDDFFAGKSDFGTDLLDPSVEWDASDLAPAVVKLLRERWLASQYKSADAFVFANTIGRGLDYRDVGEAFRSAVKRSAITASGRLSLHSLRHGFASLLIAKRPNVVFASRQLGHSNPTVTLGTCAHLFERRVHAHAARATFEVRYAAMARTTGR